MATTSHSERARCCPHRVVDHKDSAPRRCTVPACACSGWVPQTKRGAGSGCRRGIGPLARTGIIERIDQKGRRRKGRAVSEWRWV